MLSFILSLIAPPVIVITFITYTFYFNNESFNDLIVLVLVVIIPLLIFMYGFIGWMLYPYNKN